MNKTLQVYDPPMCCSTGVCGVDVDPALVQFAADVDWLRQQGMDVQRYNLASHPAAFAQQPTVREALQKEGNACLPLITVDGAVRSKGRYPTRTELAAMCGLEAAPAATEGANADAACGPGCCCGAPSGGKKMKIVAMVVVLLAIGGIFAYKALAAKSGTPASPKAAFVMAQPSSPAPQAASQAAVSNPPSEAAPQASSQAAVVSEAAGQPAPATGQKIGQYISSFSELNTVASSQDAVFVFIPPPQGTLADEKVGAAVLAAQQKLGNSRITLGLYTLKTSSPDYQGISAQVSTPAIVVATKGKGMAAVSSADITEEKLLQAVVASSRAGGCGPSGCGSGSSGCN